VTLLSAELDRDVTPRPRLRGIGRARAAAGATVEAVTAHAGLIAMVAAHACIAFAISLWIGRTYRSGIVGNGAVFIALIVPVVLMVLLVWRFLDMAIRVRPERPLHYFWSRLTSDITDPHRIVSGTLAMTLIIVFIGTFTSLKEAIPFLHPFAWDRLFALTDRTLHFGTDPWRIAAPLFGGPRATTVINFLYHSWYFVMFLVVWVAAFSTKTPRLRLAFLYAFVLTWAVGGNLLAVVFSSAGPVYYQRLGLGADFAPLMTALQDTAKTSSVWALSVQEELWRNYTAGGARFGGISAMPSMHVAAAVLFSLYGFAVSRVFGWLLAAFAAAIMIGSVQLGWHYAIDGYAGGLLALGCWRLGRRLSGNHLRSGNKAQGSLYPGGADPAQPNLAASG
jgi:hypothetical protein